MKKYAINIFQLNIISMLIPYARNFSVPRQRNLSSLVFSHLQRLSWKLPGDIAEKKEKETVDARIAGKTLAFQVIALVRCTSARASPDTRASNTREQRTRTRASRAASTIRRDHYAARRNSQMARRVSRLPCVFNHVRCPCLPSSH